ncbi:Calpain-like protease, partial [Lachnellula suecica]
MEADAQAAESQVDKSPTKDEALKHAIHAAELYMKVTKLASTDTEQTRLRGKCKQLLSRAEEIKKAAQWTPVVSKEVLLKAPVSGRQISKKEEVILLEGSKLHGFIFPPWTNEPNESLFRSTPAEPPFYTEPADLKLSDAQREIFAGWRRPHEGVNPISDEDLTFSVEELDLVQDITTDCSVVASLCAASARAGKGHGLLLPTTMYPFDRQKFRPQVSKNGKYIFRLHFNGCFRKVTIDDRLPASNTSRCLHVIDRNNPNLLWPALIEKAYLKVRGGYDFPGSNSGTDLWVMTGWIPEQVFLQNDDLQPELLWQRILNSFGYGDVLVTLGTGKLSLKEERELGLAGEHDYAVLDMKEVGSQRLLLVKNPWCDGMVWKGKVFIPEDSSAGSWTQDLREALPDNNTLKPGTFWMNLEAVVQHFESLYLNWNPGLFKYRQDHHFSWSIPTMKNPGSFIHNPQHSLKSSKAGTVW